MPYRAKWERLKAAILRHAFISAAWLARCRPKHANLAHFHAVHMSQKKKPGDKRPRAQKA
jgi:hypothetical protein